jgi:hypothetical protein
MNLMLVVAQLEGLGGWLMNPGLLVAGAAATALPILIHLLNRRRFKVIEWAAMEFLLEADHQNRRRLQLENVLLLVLRCLAVFLIGMMLARPLLPSGAAAGLVESGHFERIVLLDDSVSMQARALNETSWEVARRRLTDLATALAKERADNSLTVMLASQPERSALDAVPLSQETIDDVRGRIEQLECGDARVDLAAAVEALANRIGEDKTVVNRVVYLLTDLRRKDWQTDEGRASGDQENGGMARQLARLAKLVQGCTVFDVAAEDDQNLSIVDAHAEGLLIAGVPTALEVAVKNQGSKRASNVRVRMTPHDVLPVDVTIPELQPQETTSVRFPLLLGEPRQTREKAGPEPRKVTIELAEAEQGLPDRLTADDVAYFSARLASSIAVLIIDGDPGDREGEGESYYLERALAPEGPVASGIVTTAVTSADGVAEDLDEQQVIFLLNADRMGDAPAETVARLEKWVARGGGLVMMPGDRVDERTFNELYWKNGEGLSPLALSEVHGDETQATWAGVQVEDVRHEVFRQFAGQDNPLLAGVKVFRWWQTRDEERQAREEITVAARLSNVQRSPVIAEKVWGDGRSVLFTVPADADWHNWPSDPSYLLVMEDLVRSLVSGQSSRGRLQVGQPIVESVDISQYEVECELIGPAERRMQLKAAPSEATNPEIPSSMWQVLAPATRKQGFYSLALRRRDGSQETRLLAANVSPEEGDLRRADQREVADVLAKSNIQLVKAADREAFHVAGQRTEIGWYLIWIVTAVLASEQVLGWWFGRWRT